MSGWAGGLLKVKAMEMGSSRSMARLIDGRTTAGGSPSAHVWMGGRVSEGRRRAAHTWSALLASLRYVNLMNVVVLLPGEVASGRHYPMGAGGER